jgi:hypothetical protein
MARRIAQLTLDEARHHSSRGGPRLGSGGPRVKRPRVLHRRRATIDANGPQHVTIRLRGGLPTFVRRFRVTPRSSMKAVPISEGEVRRDDHGACAA